MLKLFFAGICCTMFGYEFFMSGDIKQMLACLVSAIAMIFVGNEMI
jgi:hypothetical protein